MTSNAVKLNYVSLIDKLVSDFRSLRSRSDVAKLLEIDEKQLVRLLYWLPDDRRYREFEIAKRSGGTRKIAAPCLELSELQKKLAFVLSQVHRPRPSAHGFVTGRGILTNALSHSNKRFVLNIDLEDFFPSINFGRIRALFMSAQMGLSADAATIIAQICCHKGVLPQGAPTSPILSNMICMRLDGYLQKLAERSRCTYSRYADDITFSTTQRKFPRTIAFPSQDSWVHNDIHIGEELTEVIEGNGFKINRSKVRMKFRDHHQEVTGLTVNRFPNVSRKYTNQIRAMLHSWEKFGHDEAETEFYNKYDRRARNPAKRKPRFRDVVRGKLSFLRHIRGRNDRIYLRLLSAARSIDSSFEDLPGTTIGPLDEASIKDVVWSELVKAWSGIVYMIEVHDKKIIEREIDGKLVPFMENTIECGTAFSIGPREIFTCAHVVKSGKVGIYLSDELTNIPRSDIRYHSLGSDDIDAAKIKSQDLPLAGAIPIRPLSEPLEVGEQVIVLGFPKLQRGQPKYSAIDGVVLTVSTDYGGKVEMPYLTVRIPPGMSGGPVLDRRGRLVGIAMENAIGETVGKPDPEPMGRIVAVKYILEIR